MDARPDFRQSVAIGIDAYDHGVPPLRTAAADARRLGRLLADDHGYDVRLLLDERASREAITGMLADLGSTLGPDDRVLFYLAVEYLLRIAEARLPVTLTAEARQRILDS